MIQGEAEATKQAVRRSRKGAMDDCKLIKSKDDQRRQEKQVWALTRASSVCGLWMEALSIMIHVALQSC